MVCHLVISLTVVGCTFSTRSDAIKINAPARLTAEQAIHLANSEARRRKFELNAFEPPIATLKFEGGRNIWHVAYNGKSDLYDDCFSVDVIDRTGFAKLYICA